ncbi:hypothetical protein PMAYCL1PPCAC_25522, partial [Pristionchus mayeri]
MHHEIIAAHRETHETTVKMLMSRSETTAITLGIFNNVIAKNAIEKDAANINSKMCNIRQVISNIEDERRKIIRRVVENDLKKNKKSLNALIFRTVPDKAVQMYLKSMSEECSKLEILIKEVVELVSNGKFEKDLIKEAKGPLTFGLGKASDLFEEIFNVRRAAAQSPNSIVLDGLKEYIKSLTLAINSVPTLVNQSATEYIHEEMKKLEVSNNDFLKNAIGPNGENALAIE